MWEDFFSTDFFSSPKPEKLRPVGYRNYEEEFQRKKAELYAQLADANKIKPYLPKPLPNTLYVKDGFLMSRLEDGRVEVVMRLTKLEV